jgi:holo-[acyl-carrier protein] synthase
VLAASRAEAVAGQLFDPRPAAHTDLADEHPTDRRAPNRFATPPGLGVDLVDIVQFRHSRRVGGERWLRKVFTPAELTELAGDLSRLAGRFAGKEAVAKSLGTGLRGLGLRDIEILTHPNGWPQVRLRGRAADHARQLGVTSVTLSLSRDGDFALAFAHAVFHAAPAHVEPEPA